jgi:hypothetical protein
VLQHIQKNVALLIKLTRFNWGRLSAFPRKLLKSRRECSRSYGYLLCTLPSKLPTKGRRIMLNQGNVGVTDRALPCCHVSSLALFSSGLANLDVSGNRLAVWFIGFVAGHCVYQSCSDLTACPHSGVLLNSVCRISYIGFLEKCHRNFGVSLQDRHLQPTNLVNNKLKKPDRC